MLFRSDHDAIALKIRRAKTDPEPLPSEPDGLENRPEARNLVTILAALQHRTPAQILSEHGGSGFGPFKDALAEQLQATIGYFRLGDGLAQASAPARKPARPSRKAIEGALHAGAPHLRSARAGGEADFLDLDMGDDRGDGSDALDAQFTRRSAA